MIKPPQLCCEGCAIHSEANTSSSSGWGVVEDAPLVRGGCRLQGRQEGPVGQCPAPGVPFPGWAGPATAVPR